MKECCMSKRELYSRRDIVASYETRRFSGETGRRVNERELKIAQSLLPKGVVILDFPCGTGRLFDFLSRKGINVIGADYSTEMLMATRRRSQGDLIRADAFNMPLKGSSLSGIASLRFCQHYPNIHSFFKEVHRILKYDGVFVFDTFRWSPWTVLGFIKKNKKVYTYSRSRVLGILKRLNMLVEEGVDCFLFSPLIYGKLPLSLVLLLEKIEAVLPAKFMVRTFWKVRKARDTGCS